MNNRIKRTLSVLVAVLLLFSVLPLGALAASGSTDITAEVKHERKMTILPHPHGELLYFTPPDKLYAGDEVAFTPVPDEGYALKSIVWYTTDAANATDITAAKKFTMPDADVTVKVEFAEIVAATVGGKVTEGGNPVPDAAVKLYLGTAEIAATITDKDGNYSFYNVEKGTYNIVVTKGDKVKTVLVTVDSTGSFSVNVALPVSAVNSVVEVSEGAASVEAKTEVSQIVVGGLDTIAEAQTLDPGDKVTIKLTVEPKADANTQEQQAIKREAGNGKKVEFLDLSLWKQVNDAAAQPIGNDNTQLLTIVIPFDFTGVDVSSVMILRHHGSSEKLQRNPAPGQEGYVVNAQAGTITLYAMKFSDYALAYKEKTSDGGGSGGSGGKTPVSEDTMPFVDVAKNAYYYDAVKWAAKNGITSGTDATHFSPDIGTTRAQVVTFLWRTAGCPEPKGDASKFVDVPANEYYAKAVAWAIEQVITKGTSETTFSPDVVCTRAHIVTFLARFAGVADEATGYKHGFTDVKATDYFNNAVAWAKDNKVTEGTSATTFSPHVDCTRAQVVTFLYRWMVK